MRRAAARGCRLFDFGRSKLGTGAFAFKKNWGFDAASRCTTATSWRPAQRSRTTIRSTRNTGCSSRPGSGCRCRSPTCSARRSCAAWAERDARSAVPGAPHPLSARQGRQDPCLAHAPASGAHASRSSRLLRRRPGGPPACRDAALALRGCRLSRRSTRARSVCKALLRLRPGQPLSLGYFHDRRLQRWVDGKLADGSDRQRLRVLLRHGAVCRCMPQACAACSTWWMSIPRSGPPTPTTARCPARCDLGARGAHAARLRAPRGRAFRSHPVRLGAEGSVSRRLAPEAVRRTSWVSQRRRSRLLLAGARLRTAVRRRRCGPRVHRTHGLLAEHRRGAWFARRGACRSLRRVVPAARF